MLARSALCARPLLPISLVLAAAVACASPRGAEAQSARQLAASRAGMVSSAQPLATEAGVRILEAGGNAADAAVAAGFAIAVVEPSMNSIGGRNQILVRLPDGTVRGVDGTTQAPEDYDYDTAPQSSYGYPVIGIPGAAAGLLRLHEAHGSLPLETVMAPAIDYAEKGFRLLPGEAARHASVADRAREFPGTRAVYLEPDGSAYDAGDLLVQWDYGRTLRTIAAGGHDAFYRGEIAERMAADLAAHGSAVTLEAIQGYEARDAGVLRGRYRGHELVALDVPAAGVVVIQALQAAERFDPDAMSDAQWAAVMGQAVRLASSELDALGTDTAAARATSEEWAARVAERIRVPADADAGGTAAAPVRREPTGGWLVAAPGGETGREPPDRTGLHLPTDPGGKGTGHTTHLTVADADGMVVALTQTLGPTMGSKVVTPGLGFLYASTLGGYLGRMEAGERARSFISPVMVLRDGEPVLALGAAGGSRIVAGVAQVISRVLDDGMTLGEALEAPRVFMSREGELDVETTPVIGWSPEEIAAMEALGIETDPVDRHGAFSRVHAVMYDPDTRTWIGAADPDWEGSARGPGPRSQEGG